MIRLRFASCNDAGKLLDIYSKYIDTPITFEYTLPSTEEFRERISNIISFYPYIVCEKDDEPIGYAYAHRHMERVAYQWNAELSVYIKKNFTSKGLGKILYSALMEILKLQGIRTVYGCVTVPNEKSEALHTGLGFRQIGIYLNAGYKNGEWRDVRWYEKQIGDYNQKPLSIVSLRTINGDKLEGILDFWSDNKSTAD